MSNNYKTKFLGVIGFIISGIFCFFAFRNFRWEALAHVLLTISPVPFMLAGMLMVVSFSLRAYRWNFFLPKNEHYTFSSRLSAVAIGYFFSNILPGRLGDVVRPAYLSKINNKGFRICLYSIFLERVWELVLFFLFSAFFFKLSSVPLSQKLDINYNVLISLLVMGLIFLFFSQRILKLGYKLSTKLKFNFITNSIYILLNAFEDNLKGKRFVWTIFLSAIIFLLEGLFYSFLIESAGISISLFDKYMVMIIASLSIMLPSAPSAIGVFHYFCQFALTIFGIDKELALSVAILIHAYMFIFDFLFAIACIVFGPIKSKFFLKREYLSELK